MRCWFVVAALFLCSWQAHGVEICGELKARAAEEEDVGERLQFEDPTYARLCFERAKRFRCLASSVEAYREAAYLEREERGWKGYTPACQ